MVSPQLIKRYPFFGGLTEEQVKQIAILGEEEIVQKDDVLFETGEEVDELFLVEKGEFGLYLQATDRHKKHSIVSQLMGTVEMEGVLVSTVEPGEVVGWSALIPPHEATATVMALEDSLVITLSGMKLRELFDQDRGFECVMIQKVAQVIRKRLQDRQIESIAFKTIA